MAVYVCVYLYRNISGTTRSISIKFDILGKTFIFYFSKNFSFCGQFLIFEKHYLAFFSIIPLLQTIQLICIFWSSGSTVLFGR
ncbi:hypothetical protein TSAR_002504 [Trichomalopsis sarcophagae]|uniref:Uncharacterized protein n=1 Tax=Trichomalopsis sarcophagae TaxID=543379 RepID=A0A232EHW2_9HYME|nr:hypothetical protein TSAR_002504 [Trichomalopsis sarcophagae]